jgi:hypothetical protein
VSGLLSVDAGAEHHAKARWPSPTSTQRCPSPSDGAPLQPTGSGGKGEGVNAKLLYFGQPLGLRVNSEIIEWVHKKV